jgi:hypothetical protein
MGWTAGVWFLGSSRDFSFLHSVQTGSGARLASYTMGRAERASPRPFFFCIYFFFTKNIQWVPGTLFPEVKQLGREADHFPPSTDKVENDGTMPPFLHMSFGRSA